MNKMDFAKGIGLGMAAGAAVSMLVNPKKKKNGIANKAIKAAESVVNNISGSMN